MSHAATTLHAFLADSAADFKVVAQKHDVDGPTQDRALDIVRQFIVDRGLILYGGLAIDYALRLKGGGLYPDGQRPDFDFYSPNSVEDAYELAEILQRAGFKNVGAIRAMHVQTTRVRVDFLLVADVSYAPPDVFTRLPTIDYGGVRALHPDYQRLDMHLAFCFPFSGAPLEDIFHRWARDDRRLAMFQGAYPVQVGALAAAAGGAAEKAPPATLRADLGIDASDEVVALHGIAAFGLLLAALRELSAAASQTDHQRAWPEVSVEVDGSAVAVRMPAEHAAAYGYIAVASPQPERLCAVGGRAVQWYEPYMDAKPTTAVITGDGAPLHVYSTRGRELAVVAMKAKSESAGAARVLMVTPQYLLLYFLFEAHAARDPAARDVATRYYLWTLELLREGAGLLAASLKETPEEKGFDRAKFINSTPFGLTTRTMGSVNHDAAYIIKMAGAAQDVKDTPPPALHLGPNIGKILDGLPPRGYYPAPGKTRPPKFDYGRNVMFRRSGKPTDGPADLFA